MQHILRGRRYNVPLLNHNHLLRCRELTSRKRISDHTRSGKVGKFKAVQAGNSFDLPRRKNTASNVTKRQRYGASAGKNKVNRSLVNNLVQGILKQHICRGRRCKIGVEGKVKYIARSVPCHTFANRYGVAQGNQLAHQTESRGANLKAHSTSLAEEYRNHTLTSTVQVKTTLSYQLDRDQLKTGWKYPPKTA